MGLQIDDRTSTRFCLRTINRSLRQIQMMRDIRMIHMLSVEYNEWGLAINLEKSEYLVTGGQGENLNVKEKVIKNREECK